MPIAMAPLMTEVTITRISAEQEVRHHLQEMGLTVGSRVTVIDHAGGNVVMKVLEGRVCLDKMLARGILVA
ncbi:MAG: ferrous iron transport protein A [Clostridia bacterium]|nr:ferrous iron transport protein A [Clostridia bacterium]